MGYYFPRDFNQQCPSIKGLAGTTHIDLPLNPVRPNGGEYMVLRGPQFVSSIEITEPRGQFTLR